MAERATNWPTDGDTWNPGRERPLGALDLCRGAVHGVVHVLGSVSALIGTPGRAAQNAAPTVVRRIDATRCAENAFKGESAVDDGRDAWLFMAPRPG